MPSEERLALPGGAGGKTALHWTGVERVGRIARAPKEKGHLGEGSLFRSVGPGAVPGGIRTSRFSESRLYVPSGFCNPCHLAGGGFVDVFYDDGRWSKPRSNFFSSYKGICSPNFPRNGKLSPEKSGQEFGEQLTETKAAHAVDWTSKGRFAVPWKVAAASRQRHLRGRSPAVCNTAMAGSRADRGRRAVEGASVQYLQAALVPCLRVAQEPRTAHVRVAQLACFGAG